MCERTRYGDRKPEDPTRDYYKEEVERQLCELPSDKDSSDEEE